MEKLPTFTLKIDFSERANMETRRAIGRSLRREFNNVAVFKCGDEPDTMVVTFKEPKCECQKILHWALFGFFVVRWQEVDKVITLSDEKEILIFPRDCFTCS
ncbi:MAG: hypothetical protein WCT49_02590 [Candidatus Paceibacterota bacterium]|nr:hypothetical protein [Candidatus Paceibacterota bacterium]